MLYAHALEFIPTVKYLMHKDANNFVGIQAERDKVREAILDKELLTNNNAASLEALQIAHFGELWEQQAVASHMTSNNSDDGGCSDYLAQQAEINQQVSAYPSSHYHCEQNTL
jgi:anaerobic glycerol-3-phosphate dehydrogenase